MRMADHGLLLLAAGAPYAVQTATWDAGSYPNSNNPQNDHELITMYLPLIKDDANNSATPGVAEPLCTAASPCSGDTIPLITVAGSISIRGDVDTYVATVARPGRIQAQLTVAPPIVTGQASFPGMRRSNLWAKLRLLNEAGAELASVQHDTWSTPAISIDYQAAAEGEQGGGGGGAGAKAAVHQLMHLHRLVHLHLHLHLQVVLYNATAAGRVVLPAKRVVHVRIVNLP
jgi:hypothetical protein